MQRHPLFSGILKQSHLHQKNYLRFVSYLQLFFCLECYFLHKIRLIDFFLDLTKIDCQILPWFDESFCDTACCCNLTKYPTKWKVHSSTAHGDFEDVVDFDLTFVILISLELFSQVLTFERKVRWISSFCLLSSFKFSSILTFQNNQFIYIDMELNCFTKQSNRAKFYWFFFGLW